MRSARVALWALGVSALSVTSTLAQSVPSEERPTTIAAASRLAGESFGSGFLDALDDPILARLIDEALQGSPALRAGGARREGAGAGRTQAALELIPSVGAS